MKKKNEMLRNLLYSFCLHILFLLILIFNNNINSLFTKKITNINSLNITSDFLEKNDIKTTNDSLYANLSLNEKVELYKMAKKNGYNPNEPVNNSNEQVKDIIQENITNTTDKNYVLYLGPTDYRRYINRTNKKIEKNSKI